MKHIYLLIICAFLCTNCFNQQHETEIKKEKNETVANSTGKNNEETDMTKEYTANYNDRHKDEKCQPNKSSDFLDSILSILSIIAIVLLLIITILACYIIKITKRLSKSIQKDKTNSFIDHLSKELRRQIEKLEKEKKELQNEANRLKKCLSEKERQIADYKNNKNESVTVTTIKNDSHAQQKTTLSDVRYLKMAKGGQFKKSFSELDSECFYRCWNESGKTKFDFCGDEGYAIANEPAILSDICIIHKDIPAPTKIVNITPGILDSDLKVIQKAIIKFV